MLPDILSESYMEYKADTNAFVTWLSITAISCGYAFKSVDDANPRKPLADQSTNALPTRLKGKARKDAKKSQATAKPQGPSTNHLVSIKELLDQAKFVAAFKKPKVKVPLGTQYVLKRAINTRKKCTEWFEGSTTAEDSSGQSSNEAHQHFTSVLESAWDVLRPNCAVNNQTKTPQAKTKTHASSKPSTDSSLGDLGNRFEMLELEELDEGAVDMLVAEATNIAIQTVSGKKTATKVVDTYELEVGVKEELPLLVCCFIEDLHKLRTFIKQTWQDVADGKLDYRSAAVVTQVSLELVLATEKKLASIWPEPLKSNPYSSMIMLESSHKSLGKARRNPLTDNEYVYINTFMSLQKFIEYSICKIGQLPCSLPVGHVYSTLRIPKPQGNEWIAEDKLLTQLLHDLELKFQYYGGYYPGTGDPLDPIQNAIEKALEEAMSGGGIGVQCVFAARTYLDIHKIMGSQADTCWADLRQKSANITVALKMQFVNKLNPETSVASWYPTRCNHAHRHEWGAQETVDLVHTLALKQKLGVKENGIVGFKQHAMKRFPTPYLYVIVAESKRIMPSPDPCFMYKTNTLYCGLECICNSLLMHEVAIDWANFFGYFAGVAHIYNAVRQLGLIEGNWEVMDTAIETYIGPLFRGSLPTTQQQMHQRLCLMMKVPLSQFASNVRKPGWEFAIRDSDKILEHDYLAIKLKNYLEAKLSPDDLLLALNNKKPRSSAPKTAASKNRELTTIQQLEELRDEVTAVLPKLDLDLVSLSRKCQKLLVCLREELLLKANLDNMKDGEELGDSVIRVALSSASDIICYTHDRECRGKCKCGRKYESDPIHGHPWDTPDRMKIAAEVMQEFLVEANTIVEVEPFDVVASSREARLRKPATIWTEGEQEAGCAEAH